jgi:plastocyanin
MNADIRRSIALAVVVAGLLFALPAWATLHQVTVQSFNFNPSDLTVAQGDTVRWVTP